MHSFGDARVPRIVWVKSIRHVCVIAEKTAQHIRHVYHSCFLRKRAELVGVRISQDSSTYAQEDYHRPFFLERFDDAAEVGECNLG